MLLVTWRQWGVWSNESVFAKLFLDMLIYTTLPYNKIFDDWKG